MQRDNESSDQASAQDKGLGPEASSSSVESSGTIETITSEKQVDVPGADVPIGSLSDPSITSTPPSNVPEDDDEDVEDDGDGEPSSDDEPPEWTGGLPRAQITPQQTAPKSESTTNRSESRAPAKSARSPAGKPSNSASATNKGSKPGPVTGQTTSVRKAT